MKNRDKNIEALIETTAHQWAENPPLKHRGGAWGYELEFTGTSIQKAIEIYTPTLVANALEVLPEGTPYEIYIEIQFGKGTDLLKTKHVIGWYTYPGIEESYEDYSKKPGQDAIYRILEGKYIIKRLIV